MNNKGFGIMYIFLFAIFVVGAVFSLYTFITDVLGFTLKNHTSNYINEYSKYFKPAINDNQSILFKDNNENKEYNSYCEMEKAVSNAAKEYMKDLNTGVPENENLYIKLNALQRQGYIKEITDINGNTYCEGYTVVNNVKQRINYNSYIKCGNNYMTEGYDNELQK